MEYQSPVEQVVETLKKDLPTLFKKDIKDGLIYEYIDTWDRKPSEILKQFLRKGKDS